MPRYTILLLAVATVGATAVVCAAQGANQAGPTTSATQAQPAPIERAYPVSPNGDGYGAHSSGRSALLPGQLLAAQRGTARVEAVQGVYLRVGEDSAVREISADAQRTELRVEHGIANLQVHDPAKDMLLLVDLPGGQVQVIKNGFYTFNAATNTVRVLVGEAQAYPGTDSTEKPIKVKEGHEVAFGVPPVRSTEFAPEEARADLIPGPNGRGVSGRSPEGREGEYGYGPYANGFYGYSPYGYPYFAYGYPWGWGYPYGWGYPFGFGAGFGYYGGFRGGFHGGYYHGGHRR